MSDHSPQDIAEAQRLRELAEDLQLLRDALMRLSLALHDHQFALAQEGGIIPAFDLSELDASASQPPGGTGQPGTPHH